MEVAVIKTGGKQYVVSKGDSLTIEKLPGEHKKGDKVAFDQVLLVDNGSDTTIGVPTIKGASVKATVMSVGRAKKVEVAKFKAKSRYYKRRGHRQPYVRVKIDKIS
jgi:large subunit ribosomal protein L21